MTTGNKGEWSELYAFFRLVADGKLYAADGNIEKSKKIYFPIIKIIREETKDEIYEYRTGEVIKITLNGILVTEIAREQFEKEADELLEGIRKSSSQGAFALEKTENFMNTVKCYRLSAPSTDKSDISLQIFDINTGYSPVVNFSIKSELGAKSTLLNAGKTTNFTYEVIAGDDFNLLETNEIVYTTGERQHADVKGRISSIVEKGGRLEYRDMDNSIFKDNLILIDSNMDKIIAETLLYYYRDGIVNCADMVKKLEQENILNFGNVHAYSYKFKKFLASVALGMKPATQWDGKDEATGGYIIVTREGDVVAYHIYNRNYFEGYLLKNTKYETASTKRHEFGEVYAKDIEMYIKLNLQVRFI